MTFYETIIFYKFIKITAGIILFKINSVEVGMKLKRCLFCKRFCLWRPLMTAMDSCPSFYCRIGLFKIEHRVDDFGL